METVLQGRSKTVVIGPQQPFCIIGERINPTGRKRFAAELRGGDLSTVAVDTNAQIEAGADGYSADASSAVKKAKELIQLKRAQVPA